VVAAIARRDWLVHQRSAFETAYANWKMGQQKALDALKEAGIQGKTTVPGAGFRPIVPSLEDDLQQIISDTFNLQVDFHQHPNFNKNANMQTDGSEEITSGYLRTEFVRTQEEFRISVSNLNVLQRQLDADIRNVATTVMEFGRRRQPVP
jgi:hypothetical protein